MGMKTRMNSGRARQSSIQQLSPDLLRRILIACLPEEEYVRPAALRAPLLLLAVCSSWRQITLDTPAMWCSLSCYLTDSNPRGQISLLRRWLYATSGLSLFIHSIQTTSDCLSKLSDTLVANAGRLRQLRVILPHTADGTIFRVLKSSLRYLYQVEVTFQGSSWTAVEHDLHIAQANAPRLKSLVLRSSSKIPFPIKVESPTITQLDLLCPLSISACIRILSRCPQLTRCRFGIDASADDGSKIIQRHSRLQSLSIESHGGDLTRLLEKLSLPSLHALSITSFSMDLTASVWGQEVFNQFIVRSRCSIVSLCLVNALSSDTETLQTLALVSPFLVELSLIENRGAPVFTNKVAAMMTPASQRKMTLPTRPPILCPHLKILKLGKTLSTTDGALADMVEVRWAFGGDRSQMRKEEKLYCRFKKMRVESALFEGFVKPKAVIPRLQDGRHMEDIRRLLELNRQGLQIY